MTYAQWKLTILAGVILILTLWQGLLNADIARWIIVIAATFILVAAWTIVAGKPFLDKKKGKK